MAFLSKILTKKKPYYTSDSPRLSTSSRDEGAIETLSVKSPSRQPASSRPSFSTTQTSRDGKVYEGPCLETPLQWLHTCRRKHRYCSELLRVGYRPTRLVDLGPTFDFSRARLVESSPHDGPVDYLALSYCWGSTMPEAGKTTVATLVAQKGRLRRAKLPRTFKHFFEIAKLLNVRHVWIDSLCIIQDSEADWQRESACIGQIYSGAVCTIAAESAKDSQGGIWLESRTRKIEDGISTTYESISQEQNLRNYLSVIDQRLHKTPLQQRGWSLPERDLSTRVLHFTFSHIYWECRELKMNMPVLLAGIEVVASSPAGRQASSQEWQSTKLRPFDLPMETRTNPHSKALLSSLSTANLFIAWRTLIEDYTGREFTRWSDRLPALSGVANEIQLHVNSEYIVGLWSDDPQGLLWAIGDTVHVAQKLESGAPSWSWASHESDPITYGHIHQAFANDADENTLSVARIVHTHIVPAGLDPKGRTLYGSLQLKSRVRWITTSQHFHSMRCTFYREDATSWPIFEYSERNPVLVIQILESETKGSWGLVLTASKKYGLDEFERVGVIGGIDNRWFDSGFDKTITIV